MEGKICLGWVGKREVYNIGVGGQKRAVTVDGGIREGGGEAPAAYIWHLDNKGVYVFSWCI